MISEFIRSAECSGGVNRAIFNNGGGLYRIDQTNRLSGQMQQTGDELTLCCWSSRQPLLAQAGLPLVDRYAAALRGGTWEPANQQTGDVRPRILVYSRQLVYLLPLSFRCR